jgi:hypothetical protein
MVDSPWLGLYEINDDEPVIVQENFESDTDTESRFGCLHATGSDSEPEGQSSVVSLEEMPDLSTFESDDDDDVPIMIGSDCLQK